MTVTFPLAPADWQDNLPASRLRLVLREAQNVLSRTAAGDVIRDEVAEGYWRVLVSFGRLTREELSAAEALVDILKAQQACVLITPPFNRAPKNDPDGTVLGGNTPQVSSIDRTARTIALSGLPPGYVLERGDYLSITYDSDRWSLHKVVSKLEAANGLGFMLGLSIEPNIPRAITTPQNVRLFDPQCLAVLTPGTATEGSDQNRVTSGMSFELQSTLRPANA